MNLTQTATLTRQVITLSVIAIVLGTLSFIGYKIWYAYYLANLPPVEEKADAKFGLLPPIHFPRSSVSSSNFSYSIDTTTGNLPEVGVDPGFEKLIKVYFVTKTFATLLSAEKSQSLAEKFGITTPPEILSETNYSFKGNGKNLIVNLDSGNFVYKKEATVSAGESLDDDNKLVADFKRNLQLLGIYREDLGNGRTHISLLKKEGEQLIPTQLRTEAAAAQISLWPAKIDDKPIFTPDYNVSEIFAVVAKSADNLENYLELNFTYYPIESSTFATYPVKSTQTALDDLKNGKGVVVIEPPNPQVSITSIYLAYFLAESYSPYLQPIFVFEGPQFVAYAPAITEEFQSPAK